MAIKITNVLCLYDKKTTQEKRAVSNVSLTIENGEFVALLGKTGCGKSTLLKLISGLEKPESGSISVDENSCMLFQKPEKQLFAQTVLEDVMYGPLNIGQNKEQARLSAIKALSLVGIEESLYEANPSRLSGGQKRKVSLAGILAMERPIILLDEPTAGLDSKSAMDIMNILKKLNEEGTTVIFATHDCELASVYAKRVIVLNEGALAFDKTSDELFENSDALVEYGVRIPSIYLIGSLLHERGVIKEKTVPTAQKLMDLLFD